MSDTGKPRVRVDTNGRVTAFDARAATHDSFQNWAAQLGIGTANLSSGGTYGFNPISRQHTMLEWMYRGSWLVRKIVDVVADDMTRARIQVTSDEEPDELEALDQYWNRLLIWTRINQTIKWARLYGGCLAVMMIDGQRPQDPLQVDGVGLDQFKGLLVLDRWMVWPHLEDPVLDYGTDFGTPRFYSTVGDAKAIPSMKIHHSRCIRIDGIELPYWQRITENDWGLSVIEPMFDRMLAFDSTTQGAAQLVYKAHLRTYYVENLREIIATEGRAYQNLIKQVNIMRLMQTNEGMSLFDASDRFEAHTYSFGGLSDVMAQFAQQLSGAADVPLTRLFGQAPAGLNATGESDLRNYYDMINANQESRLRRGIETLRSVTYRSLFGKAPVKGETFTFTPLWQMTDAEKASHAASTMQTATAGFESQLLSQQAAMKEIKQQSRVNGFGTNITDQEIEDAKGDEPPSMSELTGGRLDNPLEVLKFKAGLKDGPSETQGEQPGEEQLTGGEVEAPGEQPGESEQSVTANPLMNNVKDRRVSVGDSASWLGRWLNKRGALQTR